MVSKRALVYHNFSRLLDAGVPINRSLNTAASGFRGGFAGRFRRLAQDISSGDSLAEAMAKYPRAFKPLDITLVKTAENSGNFPGVLEGLARWYDFREKIRQKFISAMILPLLILHAAAFLAPLPFLLMGQISIGPYIWQVVVFLSYFYLGALAIGGFYYLSRRIDFLSQILDEMILTPFILGKAVLHLCLYRFCQSLQLLLQSAVPISVAVDLARTATGNKTIEKMFRGAVKSVQAGNSLSEGLSHKLPAEFLESLRIGEETGKLDEAAGRLARIYQDSSQMLLSIISRWIPIFIYCLISLKMIAAILRAYGMISLNYQ